MKDDYKITFIRGATTASGNTISEIEVAVVELIDELISRNNLIKTNILSITFTATKDLNACFPSSNARKNKWYFYVFFCFLFETTLIFYN